VQVEYGTKSLLRRTLETVRRLVPRKPALLSWEARILAAVWVLAALTTLAVALSQSLRMFALSSLAVTFGTFAAVWMLNGLARRR
jgi:hypothetical protein